MPTKHYDAATFRSGDSIAYLLKMAHSSIHDSATAAFEGHDLSFVQWIVLMKLYERAAVTASDLCRLMRHDNGAFTRLLDQLEERGFIVRKRSGQDRRVVDLSLTAAGQKKATSLIPRAVNALNDGFAEFSKAEFAALVALLEKFIAKMQAP